ncbi:MAG TPA: family 1 encapsulin nanocompartment shell protein [Nitrospiraceae bacterium]
MPPRLMVGDDEIDVQSLGQFYQSMPARLLESNLNLNSLRTMTLLHKDEWELLDSRVVEISANVLNAIADLRAMGLTTQLGGLGVLVSQYEQVSDMTDANVNMAVETDDEEDRLNFPLVGVPVPIISKGFRIDARSLAATRRNGGALDTTHADTATRKVAEKMEEMFFVGSTVVQRGQTIPGVLTQASRNVVTGGADWGTATNIYPNVLAMIGALQSDNHYGPYRLYLHPDQYIQTFALNASTAIPIIETLQRLPGLGMGSIKPSNFVTAGQGVLINMSSDVIDYAEGQATAPVEWETKGGLVTHFKILAAGVVRVKADAAGRSGIAHINGI